MRLQATSPPVTGTRRASPRAGAGATARACRRASRQIDLPRSSDCIRANSSSPPSPDSATVTWRRVICETRNVGSCDESANGSSYHSGSAGSGRAPRRRRRTARCGRCRGVGRRPSRAPPRRSRSSKPIVKVRHRRADLGLHQGHDRRGVDASREERAERNVRISRRSLTPQARPAGRELGVAALECARLGRPRRPPGRPVADGGDHAIPVDGHEVETPQAELEKPL